MENQSKKATRKTKKKATRKTKKKAKKKVERVRKEVKREEPYAGLMAAFADLRNVAGGILLDVAGDIARIRCNPDYWLFSQVRRIIHRDQL